MADHAQVDAVCSVSTLELALSLAVNRILARASVNITVQELEAEVLVVAGQCSSVEEIASSLAECQPPNITLATHQHAAIEEALFECATRVLSYDPSSLANALRSMPSTPRAAPECSAEELGAVLLDALRHDRATPALPVRTHAERLPSGDRGLSLAALRALRTFYRAHGGLDKVMADVCKQADFETNVCKLTRSTGLSLAESLALTAEARGADASALVSRATTFFSYSWTGTKLGDMLEAVERTLAELEASVAGRHGTIQGLKSRTDLNGQLVRVLEWTNERWTVEIVDGDVRGTVRVRADNLVLENAPCTRFVWIGAVAPPP